MVDIISIHPLIEREITILFNRPTEGKNAQVCLIDLNQVERP